MNPFLNGLIPTPYGQCIAGAEDVFRTRNNKNQMKALCAPFPASGYMDVSPSMSNSNISRMTTGACSDFSVSGNRNKCISVMDPIRIDMTGGRDQQLVQAQTESIHQEYAPTPQTQAPAPSPPSPPSYQPQSQPSMINPYIQTGPGGPGPAKAGMLDNPAVKYGLMAAVAYVVYTKVIKKGQK